MAFNFLRRTLVENHGRYTVTASPNHRFQDFFNPIFVKYISTNSNEQSFTVSYLINSCGLSPESALKTSKKLQLETPEKADLVLTLFRNSGFSETQIYDLIRRCPSLLLSNPERSLLPKLEFFHSKGFLSTDFATVLSRYPRILLRSLNNHIIPSFTYLSNLLQSSEMVIALIKRIPFILYCNLQIFVEAKFNVLREIGVPETHIVKLLYKWPTVFINYSRRFDETVELLKKMGMDPLRSQFVKAIVIMSTMSKSEWDKKVDVYKRLHWSEEEIFAAFQKNPCCMMTSDDKIMAVMDIFVNKMGWEPSTIAQRPILFSLSLEKRIIPRAAVVQFLSSKGLLKTNFISATPYTICDEAFLQKFVNCYDEAPQLKKQFAIRAKLLPKLEYFHSKGFSRLDLAKILWSNTTILQRSLKNHLIPSFTDLTNLFQSTEKAITVVKRKPGILDRDLKINVSPKVNYLRDIGMPDSRIVMSLHTWPSIFEMHFNRFQEIVDLVKKMGINPLRLQFVKAIVTVSMMSKSEWDKKVDVYKRLHWSEEEILAAFQKSPWCMMTSEDKIMAVMDCFVNKMGWEPSAIAQRPILFSLSLEKRIIPRAAVVQFLSSNGLLKANFLSVRPYLICEKTFLQKFVSCYDESPRLMKLYNEKLDLSKKRN